MNWLTNFGVGKKIMGGFGILAVIIAVTVTVATISIESNEVINERVFDLRVPTVLNTQKGVDGINYSLAALRGWMILGKDQFKDQRQDAWRKLREAESNMQGYAKHWTNQENVRRLEEISRRLDAFEAAQNEVEAVSHTIDETPATKILLQDAAPQAKIIIRSITRMIDIEANQAATAERKRLLGMMADVRGSMGLGLANIRAYLLTGDAKFKDQFDKFWATNEKRFGDLSRSSRLFTSSQRSAFNNLRTARAKFAPLPPKMFEIRGSDKWNTANYLLGAKAAPEAGKLLGLLRAMATNQEGLASTDIAAAKTASSQLVSFMFVLGVVAVGIAIVVAVFISRMVTNPVAKAAEGLKAIARGDLTRRYDVTSKDELGQMIGDMNTMSESLTRIVAEVRANSNSIASGSQQISSGNANLSQRTEEQASSLEETAASMEEMTSTVKQNADSAQQAAQLANAARNDAEKGGQVVERTVKAMSEINASSTRIADIISTIDAIAFQTNLLALNAAVEAARAGEQGRGFAVVASEVRTLAQRSADAAKEIKGLIEDSVGKVKAGTDLVDESGQTLTGIVESIKKVADIVAEINAASQEQSAGIDQVNTAVTQMDDMTQQNAALVEEAAAASRSMQDQAAGMSELMTFFTVGDSSNGLGSGDSYQPQSAIENVPARQVGGSSPLKDRTQNHLQKLRDEKAETRAKKTGTDGRQEWEDF
jgi:methyl-accepting chemotaxis protein